MTLDPLVGTHCGRFLDKVTTVLLDKLADPHYKVVHAAMSCSTALVRPLESNVGGGYAHPRTTPHTASGLRCCHAAGVCVMRRRSDRLCR